MVIYLSQELHHEQLMTQQQMSQSSHKSRNDLKPVAWHFYLALN